MVDRACPSCGEALKTGMLSQNELLPPFKLAVINAAESTPSGAVCNKCGDTRYATSKSTLSDEANALKVRVRTVLPRVPVLSLQSPSDWSYTPLSIVTAQSVTGTGIFSDVASAFTDLFGTQSGTYNAKIREGENLCKASLRAQAIEMGGSAVIAVDVDYAEVGGQRAMLMVCMTGTAVRLSESENIDLDYLRSAHEATEAATRIRNIEKVLNFGG